MKGIGEKTAQELVNTYGTVENILAHAAELTKKRPREALLEQGDMALLSKELVTIRDDLPWHSISRRCASRSPIVTSSFAVRRARVSHAREGHRSGRGRG